MTEFLKRLARGALAVAVIVALSLMEVGPAWSFLAGLWVGIILSALCQRNIL